MDHTGGTEALRVAAPEWSLAGDRQLLGLLQNIHQKILSRCQETNSKLEQMVSALDNASVSLQNVNNRFMALSNNQFIESRVYDDDTDVTTETPVTKPEPPITDSIRPSLELGLATIKRLHSPAEILQDSDSSTDDDDVLGTILVPKNMYSDRRLPYIIGTNNWRSQRHAGLISDASDSNTSGDEVMELYSNSDVDERQSNKIGIAISTSSSEHIRPVSPQTDPVLPLPTPPRSQSDVAAELARRLGRGAIPEPKSVTGDHIEPEMPRKLYKPTPNAGTIFSDEPPPLLQDSSESNTETYDDDDVFAEINRKAPYDSGRKVQSGLEGGLTKAPPSFTQQSTLFGEEEDSDLFGDKPPSVQHEKQNETRNIKKPIGAISLFGTNQGAETIGAAILRRNLNKSTSSEDSNQDDTDSRPTVNHSASGDNQDNVIKKVVANNKDNVIKKVIASDRVKETDVKVEKTTERPKERDIFDDLFAKSAINNKEKVIKSDVINKKVETPAKVDIFSDNIFDDIDDIFASEAIVKDVGKKVEKSSIFDDVDDLFSEVAAEKVVTKVVKSNKVFESDDDLFSDKPSQNRAVQKTNKTENEPVVVKNATEVKSKDNIEDQSKKIEIAADNNKIGDKIKSSRSIFDSDDDDELFSDNPVKAKTDTNEVNKDLSVNTLKKESEALFDADDDIFASIKPVTKETLPKVDTNTDEIRSNTNQFKEENKENNNTVTNNDSNDEIKSDEWSDGDDSQKDTKIADNLKVLRETKIGAVESPSLFSDDDVDYFNKKLKDSVFDHVEEISKNVAENVSETSNVDGLHNEVVNEKSGIESSQLNDTNIINEEICRKKNKPVDIIHNDNNFEDNKIETVDNNIKLSKDILDDLVTEEKDIFTPKNQESKLQNTNTVLDNTQTNLDNNKNVENNTLFPKQEALKSNEVDIFDDIFADQPPAFEKPKEKKKSQNINALFDDDSDDEALFLRKTDNFTDELPDELPVNTEPVFTIFHDEPPALDADIAKTVKIPEPSKEKFVPKVLDNTDGVATSKTEEIPKPVGKLKPLNFNINVNTLLPGSPKKVVKITAPIDSTSSSPDLSNDFEETESKMVKSVSFDGNPESPVLDNKLSKERAKIQVKRRPSTRRARKEAVRKSAIDFDTTDGGKSNDDGNPDFGNNDDGNTDFGNTDFGNNDFGITDVGKSDFDTPKDTTEENIVKVGKKLSDVATKDINTEDVRVMTDNKTQVLNINDDDVYIFRDPNIESTAGVITEENQGPIINTLGKVYETSNKVKKLNIIDDKDDGDDFFKDLGAKEAKKPVNIPKQNKTQQKTYKSLFDDMSDDENLFGEAKGSKSYINDSDEELFASGSRIKKSTVIPKTVKKSLFDDDDDLFGKAKTSVKAKSPSQPKQTSRQETASKSAQPVFADPLSLFGSDDES